MVIFYPEQSTWLSSLPMKLRIANFPLLKLQGTCDQTGFHKPEGPLNLTLINQFSYDLLRNISRVMGNSKFFMHVLNKCANMLTASAKSVHILLSSITVSFFRIVYQNKNTLIEFVYFYLVFHPPRSIFKCLPHFDYPLKRM